jgi:hypothetical protein
MICDLAQPIYWQGRQWAVTAYGVEAMSGRYHIAWRDLEDEPARKRVFDQMRDHYWVHLDDFREALEASARARQPAARAA